MYRFALRFCLAIASAMVLASCGADKNFAEADAISRAAFVSGEPPSITLYTVVNVRSGEGGHASLLIDGRQRVIYDPAGSWYHPTAPERYDMHYGMNERMMSYYIDYHARETFNVVAQRLFVSQQTIDQIMAAAIEHGAAGKATCAITISGILKDIPGFEDIRPTWFPNQLAKQFGKLPGVQERVITDDDDDSNHGVLTVQVNGEPGGI